MKRGTLVRIEDTPTSSCYGRIEKVNGDEYYVRCVDAVSEYFEWIDAKFLTAVQ